MASRLGLGGTGRDWEGPGGTERDWEGLGRQVAVLQRHIYSCARGGGTAAGPEAAGPYWSILGIAAPAVVSIEDPFDQDDWEGWQRFLAQVDIQVVGDDLTVTNPRRIQRAAELRACNCLLLKVNQIGSVTESIQA